MLGSKPAYANCSRLFVRWDSIRFRSGSLELEPVMSSCPDIKTVFDRYSQCNLLCISSCEMFMLMSVFSVFHVMRDPENKQLNCFFFLWC